MQMKKQQQKPLKNLRKFNVSKYEYDGNFFLQHDTARCRRITKVEEFFKYVLLKSYSVFITI